MLKRLSFIALAGAFILASGYADQNTKKIVIPAGQVPATSGKQMFNSYCAPCHGVDGRGHGPAAPALKVVPTDLTMLARNHNGRYPEAHVISVLLFGSGVTAHGSPEMPVWGPILGKMNRVNAQEKDLRMSNLSRYLETLQVK